MQYFEKVTGSEVEVWLASTGVSGSDGCDTPDDGCDTPDHRGDDEFDLFWSTIDFSTTTDWLTPPSGGDFGVSGSFTPDIASKEPYKTLGEKSLYDSVGGEWRPSKVNMVHPVE